MGGRWGDGAGTIPALLERVSRDRVRLNTRHICTMIRAHLECEIVAAERAQLFDSDGLSGKQPAIYVGETAALVEPFGGYDTRDVERAWSALAAMCEFDQDMVGGEPEAMCG
jgi:hypothetical protein